MVETVDILAIVAIAKEAGDAIMAIYEQDFEVEFKADNSPLTIADTTAHEIIANALKRYELPVLSEEGKSIDYSERKQWQHYWCVDPIDGTKEFIKKNGEFTVNIALVSDGVPVLGVVYAPALNELYYAKQGEGAYKVSGGSTIVLPAKINSAPETLMHVVASKSHLSDDTQAFINALPTKKVEQISRGSSLKLVMVAEGVADIYPRLAPTMEWDTAAADAIVRQSGKMSYIYDEKLNQPLQYNKEDLLNPWFVVK